MDGFLARQLAIYASYHRDERNRATHFIGIPAIVFTILVPLALVRACEGRRPWLTDNLFQAFIGPMFLMAEALIALGLKQDLKAAIDGAP